MILEYFTLVPFICKIQIHIEWYKYITFYMKNKKETRIIVCRVKFIKNLFSPSYYINNNIILYLCNIRLHKQYGNKPTGSKISGCVNCAYAHN